MMKRLFRERYGRWTTRALLLAIAYVLLILLYRYVPSLQSLDQYVSIWLGGVSHSSISFFRILTLLGNTYVVVCVTGGVYLWMKYSKLLKPWVVLVSVISGTTIVVVSKFVFQRARPELGVYDEIGYSFPSFHAMIAVALYGYVLIVLAIKYPKYSKGITLFGSVIILLLMISRVVLNVHFFSDIAGGGLVGLFSLIVATGWYGAPRIGGK